MDLKSYLVVDRRSLLSDLDSHPSAYPLRLEDYEAADPAYFMPLDSSSVPVFGFDGQDQYIPSRIAGYALARWNRALSAGADVTAEFVPCADWFARKPNAWFPHTTPVPGLTVPWYSALAQGEGISVLTRAHRLTGVAKYLASATLAFEPMEIAVEQGGLRSRLPSGDPFLEEYPGSRHPHVLNGAFFALVGLRDLFEAGADRDGRARALYEEVVASIARNIQDWDVRGWSSYNLESQINACTPQYHRVHIAFLDYFARLHPEYPTFASYGARWRAGLLGIRSRSRALVTKLRYRAKMGW